MAGAKPITGVSGETPFGAFAARVIEVRAGEVARMLAAGSSNGSTDLVHDRRVAMRRLRTSLEVFERALPKRAAKQARRDIKKVFSGLGARRDADVALAMLRAIEPRLTAPDMPGFRGLVAEIDAAGGVPVTPREVDIGPGELAARARASGGRPAAAALGRIAARRLGEVQARLAALAEPTNAKALHDLRIAAKRLRYALEAAEPALGPPAARGALTARGLQDLLGELHDCDVMLPRLRAHTRALADEDVAAVRAGGMPPNAGRYRGVYAVEVRVRARREDLREQAAAQREPVAAELERLRAELREPGAPA